MSSRTRANRRRNPGAAVVNKPAQFDRRVEHRRVRRAANVALDQLDEPENHALPLPHHISEKVDPAEREPMPVNSTKFKVWKTKSWKRRSAVRAQRAAQWRDVERRGTESFSFDIT